MERLFVDGSLGYDNPCRDAPARPHSRPNRDSKTATRAGGGRGTRGSPGSLPVAARERQGPGESTACSPRTRRSVPESPPTGGWWRGERCPRVVMGQRIYPTWKQRATGHREDCNGKMAMTGRVAWRDLCIRASREGVMSWLQAIGPPPCAPARRQRPRRCTRRRQRVQPKYVQK
jgi:hypothetical protein